MEREHNLDKYQYSPWTVWYDLRKKPSTEYTIMDFKMLFGNRRPDWAKAFSEREIRSERLVNNRYKKSIPVPDEFKFVYPKYNFIERERVIPDLNIKRNIVVERILDCSGVCQQVSLIHIKGRGIPLSLREEKKVKGHSWVSSVRDIDDKWTSSSYTKLINLPNPWSFYF